MIFASFPSPLDEGPAIAEGPIVLQRAGGQAWWFDANGSSTNVWPDDPARVRVTAGPIAGLDGSVIVGCSDGSVKALRPSGTGGRVLWSQVVQSGPDSVISIAAGRAEPGGHFLLAAGTSSGTVPPRRDYRTLRGSVHKSGLAAGNPGRTGARSDVGPCSPCVRTKTRRICCSLPSEGRSVDLKFATGSLGSGMAEEFAGLIAGSPALGDLDGDGVLEVAVTTEPGDICLYDLAGSDEPRWPRSIWHPDAGRRPVCIRPDQECGISRATAGSSWSSFVGME